MADHVHMCVSIPPKYSVAHAVGKLKGKSAIHVHQKYGRTRNVMGFRFWARGYCVSTIGLDEGVIRNYIRTRGARDSRRAVDVQVLNCELSRPPNAPLQGASSNYPLCG